MSPPPPLSSAVSSVSSPVSANFSRPMFNDELSEAEAADGNKQVSAVAHIWPMAPSLAPWYHNYASQQGKQDQWSHKPSRSFHNLELSHFYAFFKDNMLYEY